MKIPMTYLFLFTFLLSCGQKKVEKKPVQETPPKSARQIISGIRDFQDDLNMNYADADESPLTEKERKNFKGLRFYDIDTTYYIEAKFVATPDASPFEMATTTERRPLYRKFGEAHFGLKGKEHVLNIYQSIDLSMDDEYKDYLFLPYTDGTNGKGSYGGGRYMDVEQPMGDKIILDFNKSYNPYCAYNPKYSCPIPPADNHLEVAILAGVKEYQKP